MMQALDGVTVLDFTQMTQGPWATQMLADMGAEVVKVERPGTGELRRHTKVAGRQVAGEATHFTAVNRNKLGLALDLKTDEGREICLELGEEADVVVHNFRPGVMGRLGLSYEDFREVNDGVIYAHTTGYGTEGPHADKPGQDLLLQAMCGFAAATGRRDDPPTPAGASIIDYHAAALLAYGIVVALFHKERTGEGQRLDLNLFNAAMDIQHQELHTYMNLDIPFERSREGVSLWQGSAPYGLYETADGYVAISSLREEDIRALGELMDVPELTEYTERELYEKRDEIKAAIEEATPERTTGEWLDLFEEHDVWGAPVRDYGELLDDPQVEANDMIESVEYRGKEIEYTGIPVKLRGTPGEVESPPPELGEHTEAILADLGYSEAEIEELREKGVF